MREMQRTKKGIQIGLSGLFLVAFFAILLHVHERDFRGTSIHKACAICLLQYNTTALKPTTTTLALPIRTRQHIKRKILLVTRAAVRCPFDENHPNKAPPFLS